MNLEQIKQRLAELENLINTEKDPAKLEEYGKEVRSLLEERGRLMGEATGKARAEARAAFTSGTKVQKIDDTPELSEREKLHLLTGIVARKRVLTEEHKRALGVALTTTATQYVAATADADGVNNAGVLIPTQLVLDLLREEGKLSPILNDIVFTHVKGLTEFPYRKSRTAAQVKAEGSGVGQAQWEFAKLSGVKGWLQIHIAVTDEVVALTDMDLGAYIAETIANDLSEDWAAELIYGTGSDNRVKGLTVGAKTTGISAYNPTQTLEAIVAGIKLCTGQFRRGAKIYVAQDVYDAVAFAIDDNGNFKHPAINNQQGVSSIGPLPLLVDENLNAGDFVIANVGKYFKANMLQGLQIETDRDINKRITVYVASQFVASVPVPGAVVYGKKST